MSQKYIIMLSNTLRYVEQWCVRKKIEGCAYTQCDRLPFIRRRIDLHETWTLKKGQHMYTKTT